MALGAVLSPVASGEKWNKMKLRGKKTIGVKQLGSELKPKNSESGHPSFLELYDMGKALKASAQYQY
jgi:hypothetical protein